MMSLCVGLSEGETGMPTEIDKESQWGLKPCIV